jgi:hypothetical protein
MNACRLWFAFILVWEIGWLYSFSLHFGRRQRGEELNSEELGLKAGPYVRETILSP